MRLLVLLFLASCACRTERLQPSSDCGKECFPGDADIGRTGACRSGAWRCEDDGGLTCENWVGPRAEECNGRDDDCDGRVDEGISDDPHLCTNTCGVGVQQCISGRWTTCSAPQPKPEVCNGRDDDCDSQVDEPEDVASKPCYDPGFDHPSLNFGICHGGSSRCVGGTQFCLGQQVPMAETCDGIDQDCDGEIDEGAGSNDKIDFVLIFDNSGSMAAVAASLKAATQSWVGKYSSRVDRRYALVTAPDNDTSVWGPRVFQDFTDTVGFAAAVAQQTGSTGNGEEPTTDAIDQLITPTPDGGTALPLSWRPGALRILVVFSDEEPQAYTHGCYGACQFFENDVANRLFLGRTVLHAFTSPERFYRDPWTVLTMAGRGKTWDIQAGLADGGTADLEANLDEVIRTVTCQP